MNVERQNARRRVSALVVVLFGAFLFSGWLDFKFPEDANKKQPGKMTIKSRAFEDGGMIPAQYTCEGADVSPPLSWDGCPETTESLVVIADDPDVSGKPWVHWLLYNLPKEATSIPENILQGDSVLFDSALRGVNDSLKEGYDGPCPPSGTHRYFFKVYALDTDLRLGRGATKEDLLQAMDGHVIAAGELMGRYERKKK